MTPKFLYCLLLLPAAFVNAQNTRKPITMDDIWNGGALRTRNPAGFNVMKDGKTYSAIDGQTLKIYDLTTGQTTQTVIDTYDLPPGSAPGKKMDGYEWSDDEQKIVFQFQRQPIYRRSAKSFHVIMAVASKRLTPVYPDAPQSNVTLNAAGDRAAFSANNNLFVKNLGTGDVKQITTDGAWGKIINGMCDWVYEEEFAFTRAYEWSPDGQKIAFIRFDETEVPEYTLQYYNNDEYPKIYTYKYPKVGEKNAAVSVFIYDVQTGKTIRVDAGDLTDMYVPRLAWTPGNRLCVARLNRRQNVYELLLADPKTGAASPLLKETSPTYVDVNRDRLTFLKDGKHFIRMSETDGFERVYLYNMMGAVERVLTPGPGEVTKCYGVDETKGQVYYQSDEFSPLDRSIFRVGLDGKNKTALTPKVGVFDAEFGPTFQYYVLSHSTINEPPFFTIVDATGKTLRVVEDNAGLKNNQTAYGVAPVRFFTFTTSENIALNGWMLKPLNFDSTKKYPVFMYQYSGPGSQTAINSWGGQNYWWFQSLAQSGYIVACVDGRGTGGRGEAFKKITYKELGKYETVDQIEAAKYLGRQAYVDPARIGIFGWSYGGYMSSLCILKGADVFKTAIAVAPVTNWKWYDSIYTERYMQTEKENPTGYADNSPVNFAGLLKGNFLIVHGLADDNVHFQNSAEMINALVAANKQFDSAYYPNRNHSIAGGNTRAQLYTKMTKFILEKL